MCELAEKLPLLPLTELEPLPRARTAGLLPLDGPRVAGHQSSGSQLGPMLAIGLDQGPRNGVPKGPGLPRLAAAVHMGFHIEGAERVGGGERLLDVLHQRRTGKVISQGTSVDVPLAGAGSEIDPG